MKIMVDTNLLISYVVLKSPVIDSVFKIIEDKYNLFISSYVAHEFLDVVRRKFPTKSTIAEDFLKEYPYSFLLTPNPLPEHNLFKIRDDNDEAVLYTAIIENIDILITGDKDFENIKVEDIEIMTPNDFLKLYGNQ